MFIHFFATLLLLGVRFLGCHAILFDPLTTPINIDGANAFTAPDYSAGDVRGPCPGLNALANHNYIPHNGVVTFAEAVSAINEVYGMGLDLGGILTTMGTVWVGNPLSLTPGFSIGGYTSESENTLDSLFGLLGTPRGLVGSHNFIESDSSNTRDDLYVTGDSSTMNLTKFIELYNMSSGPAGSYDMDLLAERASIRFKQTEATNPDFYYGPLTGMIARNAGYIFAGRLFANHSWENPAGVLTKETLKSFFAVSGNEDALEYTYGHESIPQNWYRVPVDWGFSGLFSDLIDWFIKYPELAGIGGNTGTVNSFTGLNVENITDGVFDVGTLLEGNNLICFIFEVVKSIAPDTLSGVFETVTVPLQMVLDILATPLLDLECPALEDLKVGGSSYEEGIQKLFPGAKLSGGGL